MKVKELITKLSELDPELSVVLNGYEGGLSDVERVRILRMNPNVNNKWYYGPHEEVFDGWDMETEKTIDGVLVL